ncbi:energy-coupling factor ABC transporter permease [Prolixibacteraceae bacterium JC049]|nr:energy-coupling factor ABC transporter permease [Prolixibacteraceae bacterium JC049]
MLKRVYYLLLFLALANNSFGMHIAEGFLPVKWAIFWALLFLPVLIYGYKHIKAIVKQQPSAKLLLAVVGAFAFVLSSFKLPSVAGSSSHLTGIALGAILFGASTMSVLGLLVLLFQALLLAHGGFTTLGANAFSMAVVGAFIAVWCYQLGHKAGLKQSYSIFIAAVFSDLAIYVCTSAQLAVAFQSVDNSFMANFIKFAGVFAVTQLPLALIEGICTVAIFKMMMKYSGEDILELNPNLQLSK